MGISRKRAAEFELGTAANPFGAGCEIFLRKVSHKLRPTEYSVEKSHRFDPLMNNFTTQIPLRVAVRGLVFGVAALPLVSASGADLSFRLACHPSAVALQFDVSSSSDVSFGSPSYQGTSPHTVESSVLLSSGSTRFVVYSTTGLPISSAGEIAVTFSSDDLADGMLTVSGVMASDASGVQTSATPTSLPVVVPGTQGYRSAKVGSAVDLGVTAYDLDGALASLSFKEGGSAFSTVFTYDPALASWTPSSSGLFDLSATAIDQDGFESTVSLGQVRAYEPADLATFEDFESIHFGPVANPSDLGFETKPFGQNISNGLAWILGMNPNSPDLSLLPAATIEDGGGGSEFVFRFNRLASLPGVILSVLESDTLGSGSWDLVPGGSLTETPVGDGSVDVEVRRAIDPETNPKGFMTLDATQAP